MDKIVTENLFLLEFLVDQVRVDPDVTRDIGDSTGDTCVSVQFLDNSPLDICEDDFTPKRQYKKENDNLKSGKSCLFSLTPSQASEVINQFDIYVDIFSKMQPGMNPDRIQIGGSLISISNLFNELIDSLTNATFSQAPTAKTLKDTFAITNAHNVMIGEICMYIRMSCFGKLIVTQFQMNLDDKSVLFKDREGHSLYRYKKIHSKSKPSTSLGPGGFDGVKEQDSAYRGNGCVNSCPNVPCPRQFYNDNSSPSSNDNSKPSYNDNSKQTYSNNSRPNFPCTECSTVSQQVENDLDTCFQEIGASMAGNCLTIRVHKDLSKVEQVSTENSSCACKTSNLTSGTNAPTLTNLVMRPGQNESKVTNAPFSFKMGGCGLPSQNNVTVVPPVCTSPNGTQYTEVSDPERDMFILKIGKKSDKPDKKSNLELELCTPKPGAGSENKELIVKQTQWDDTDAGIVQVPKTSSKHKKSKPSKSNKRKKK